MKRGADEEEDVCSPEVKGRRRKAKVSSKFRKKPVVPSISAPAPAPSPFGGFNFAAAPSDGESAGIRGGIRSSTTQGLPSLFAASQSKDSLRSGAGLSNEGAAPSLGTPSLFGLPKDSLRSDAGLSREGATPNLAKPSFPAGGDSTFLFGNGGTTVSSRGASTDALDGATSSIPSARPSSDMNLPPSPAPPLPAFSFGSSTTTGAPTPAPTKTIGFSVPSTDRPNTVRQGSSLGVGSQITMSSGTTSLKTTGNSTERPADDVTEDPPFGDGETEESGTLLNASFKDWLSQSAGLDPSCFLDPGLLDYCTFAAEIRAAASIAKAQTSKSTNIEADVKPNTDFSLSNEQGLQTQVVSPTPAPAPAPAPTPAKSLFSSFGMPTAASAPSPPKTGFTFNPKGFGATPTPAPFTGFQVPGGGLGMAAPPVSAALTASTEEDAMPKEKPAAMARADGEEDEEVTLEVRAKLYRFSKEERTWADLGVGKLRLMRNKSTDNRRIVLRNDMGKVVLNVATYQGMNVTLSEKGKSVTFIGNTEQSGPTSFMLRVKSEDLSQLHDRMVELIPK